MKTMTKSYPHTHAAAECDHCDDEIACCETCDGPIDHTDSTVMCVTDDTDFETEGRHHFCEACGIIYMKEDRR